MLRLRIIVEVPFLGGLWGCAVRCIDFSDLCDCMERVLLVLNQCILGIVIYRCNSSFANNHLCVRTHETWSKYLCDIFF